MKNFKEFREDFKDELFSSGTADLFAYAAYCQGYAEAKSEIAVFDGGKGNYFPLVPNVPYCDTQTQLLHEEAEKMKVYPEQLVKEYSPEELKEMQRGLKINGVMSEKDLNEYIAEHTRK